MSRNIKNLTSAPQGLEVCTFLLQHSKWEHANSSDEQKVNSSVEVSTFSTVFIKFCVLCWYWCSFISDANPLLTKPLSSTDTTLYGVFSALLLKKVIHCNRHGHRSFFLLRHQWYWQMLKVELVGFIKMPICYVVAEEKTVPEAILMGEACVLPLGPSDPSLEHFVRVCHGGWMHHCHKKRGHRFLCWTLQFECWLKVWSPNTDVISSRIFYSIF
jgi:hypothetical protein